jgi:ABC-2 type transport system ATP-binding protein
MATQTLDTPPPVRAASGEPVVQFEGASKFFGDFHAAEDISLTVDRGTILGLIGPSGSGKTTVVKMAIGNLQPTEGSVQVMGQTPSKFHRKARERIGYMPQSFVMYPDLTASENLSFIGSLFGMLWPRRRRRSRELLELLDLSDARNRRAGQLSGGMQRRLALACALIHDPEIIFVDEPTAGIDPVLRQTIWEEFRRLRDDGRTLFVTTQYVGESEYCDRVAILDHGRLIASDTPTGLREEAFGGDLVELELERPIDGSTLRDLPEVVAVRQEGPLRLILTVEDAGTAIPRIIEAADEQGNSVAASREYRPSFDEVFSELLEREKSDEEDGHERPPIPSA